MKEHIVVIFGYIGSFEIDGEQIKGVEHIDVVSQVNKAPDGTKVIRVLIDSPGGRKDVGDDIYNYLMSLKTKYKVVTEQRGLIASIATKIFGAGDDRVAVKGMKFMIHNPWTQITGDADTLAKCAAEMKATENELKQFYIALTGSTEEGISPLLKTDTYFDAETALNLKFATEVKEDLKMVAYMKTEEQKKLSTFIELLVAQMKKVFGMQVLAMVVEVEGGKKLSFETEDMTKLEGVAVFLIDEANPAAQTPAPDGIYILKPDGRKVTVAGGKVSTVEAGANPPENNELMNKIDALTRAFQQVQVNSQSIKDEVINKLNAELAVLRNSIKTTHVPPTFEAAKKKELAAEWDTLHKQGKTGDLRKNDPDKFRQLYFARYDAMPQNV